MRAIFRTGSTHLPTEAPALGLPVAGQLLLLLFLLLLLLLMMLLPPPLLPLMLLLMHFAYRRKPLGIAPVS